MQKRVRVQSLAEFANYEVELLKFRRIGLRKLREGRVQGN